ncbi:MAG: amidohydrolase family protein [Betaproteobacteria bacterium]
MKRAVLPDLAIVDGEILSFEQPLLEPVRGSLLVHDGRIVRITRERRPAARETLSAAGKLVMPGLVDAHCHAIHLLMRGLSDGLHYHEWLERLMYRALPHYHAADARVAAELFCAEAIRSGITTVGDSTDFGNRADLVDATLSAFRKAGMRSVYFRNFSDAPPAALRANRETATAALGDMAALMDRHAGDPLLTIGPGINEPHFATVTGFRKAVRLAEQRRVPIMAHVAEVPADATIDGQDIIDWMIGHRLLSPRLVLAHCVWLKAPAFRHIAAAGAAVTWQPSTNAYLADGVMPVRMALAAGVTVGLGTDDTNASDQVDMFNEMRTAALLTKIARRDSTAIRPAELLSIATRGGARALGLDSHIGSLAVGKAADVILLDLKTLRPFANLASALVYQGGRDAVDSVVIGGQVVMRERQLLTVDEAALRQKARKAAEGVIRRSGLNLPALEATRAPATCEHLFAPTVR